MSRVGAWPDILREEDEGFGTDVHGSGWLRQATLERDDSLGGKGGLRVYGDAVMGYVFNG